MTCWATLPFAAKPIASAPSAAFRISSRRSSEPLRAEAPPGPPGTTEPRGKNHYWQRVLVVEP